MNKIILRYEFLLFLVMLYVAVDLASMVFAYKIVSLKSIEFPAASLIFPLTYSLMDIIAEVFGYKVAKKIVWYGFICDFTFSILVVYISHVPSVVSSETVAYQNVFGLLLRATLAQTLGVLLGAFLNIYLISKWKVLTNGRYFWLRSIGSSGIGEAVMLITSVMIALSGILSFSKLFNLIVIVYLYKIIFAIVIAPFISFVAQMLKNKLGEAPELAEDFNLLYKSDKQDFSPSFQ